MQSPKNREDLLKSGSSTKKTFQQPDIQVPCGVKDTGCSNGPSELSNKQRQLDRELTRDSHEAEVYHAIF